MARRPQFLPGKGALSRWNLSEVLAAHAPEDLVAVKRSTNRWFMYNETGNENLLTDASDNVEQRRWGEVVDIVLEKKSETPKGEYSYYTGPVPGPPSKASAVWISSANSGTRAHYDAFDNEFYQLEGRKRIRIHAPLAHFAMHVYPDAHPRARKSQVNSDCPDLERFPLYSSIGEPVLDVELGPGDSITIPAFWFHEIESLTPSVSVNSFAMSPVTAAASRVFANPLVLDRDFVHDVITTCTGIGANEFLSRLISSRYTPLYGEVDPSTLPTPASLPTPVAKASVQTSFASLKAMSGGVQGDMDTQGVSEIVMAHLLELSCVRAGAPGKVHATLAGLLA